MALYSHFDGRIGKDGAKVVKNNTIMVMDVATDYFAKGENRTLWIRVVCRINERLEKMLPHLKKGSAIHVEGQQIEPNTWVGKDGNPHAQVAIMADVLKFSENGRKKREDDNITQQQTSNAQQPAGYAAPVQEQPPFPAPQSNDEDLPF